MLPQFACSVSKRTTREALGVWPYVLNSPARYSTDVVVTGIYQHGREVRFINQIVRPSFPWGYSPKSHSQLQLARSPACIGAVPFFDQHD
jgi:hypothetical protein